LKGELFRQGGSDQSERAVVQGEKARTGSEKHEGPKLEADFYRDRFEGVDRSHIRDTHHLVPESSPRPEVASAQQLKAELAEVAAMEPLTWDLPEWRPAVVSRDILSRLKAATEQLKVVSAATDSLHEQVEALYASPESAEKDADDENTEEETNDG
jgi:hypothetical protein